MRNQLCKGGQGRPAAEVEATGRALLEYGLVVLATVLLTVALGVLAWIRIGG